MAENGGAVAEAAVEVPPVVDKVLAEVAAKKGYKKPRFTVTSGSGQRDGYLSTMYRANIHDEDPSGPADISVMCKMSMNVMQNIMKDVFAAEGHIYSKVVPAMAAAAGPSVTPRWPTVLYVSTAGPPPHVIALEDFRPLGFGPPVRTKGLDEHHCRLVAQQLAKFHAASFIIKHKNPEEMKALAAPLENLFDTDEMRDTFEPFLRDIKRLPEILSDRWPENSKIYQRVQKACTVACKDFSIMVEPRKWPNDGEGCCFAHGDCQINNVAFKYDAAGRVTDCMLYDFQIVHLSSPALDLTRILLVCTDKDVRDAHLDDILREYIRDLHAHLRAGGVEEPERVYSWDLLQKHLRRTATWAMLMQPLFHGMLHCDDQTVSEMRDALAKAGAGEQVGGPPMIEFTPALRQRFLDIVQDVLDRGWMPEEDELESWLAGTA